MRSVYSLTRSCWRRIDWSEPRNSKKQLDTLFRLLKKRVPGPFDLVDYRAAQEDWRRRIQSHTGDLSEWLKGEVTYCSDRWTSFRIWRCQAIWHHYLKTGNQ